ncbi:type II secretion system inner membrane protein GspF [Pseudomonas sp. TE3610]
MAHFRYRARNAEGRTLRGVQTADSARVARQALRDRGLVVESMVVSHHGPGGVRLGSAQLALFTCQLATLVQAALPLEEALNAVAGQTARPAVAALIQALRLRVVEGHGLADALGEHPNSFPELYRATVAAGESSGHLGLVLEQLADYTQARQQARQRIQMALVYPLILFVACTGIVGFLLGFVVPDVVGMFADSGQALPWLTQALIVLSDGVSGHGLWGLGLIALAGVAARAALRRPALRLRWHGTLLRLPLLGRTLRAMDAARFASTLAILGHSAVPLLDALHIAASVVGNLGIRTRLLQAAEAVRQGSSLTHALTQAGDMPPMMLHLIACGERVGELNPMLERAAQQQEKTLAAQLALLVGLFEPLMLVVMGGVVLLIVLAILLPILSLNQLVT